MLLNLQEYFYIKRIQALGDDMLRNRLKSFRHKLEMNQKEFAAFLGVNVSLYNNWERQHRQPSLEWALKVADKLKCHVDDICFIEDTE